MKVIGNCKYVHRSALYQLDVEIPPVDFEWTLVSVSPDRISYMYVPDFDTDFEPSLVSSYCNGKVREYRNNPPIYHRRHLFVDSGYSGFDIGLDKERTAIWSALKPSKAHMGRRDWWDGFRALHGL